MSIVRATFSARPVKEDGPGWYHGSVNKLLLSVEAGDWWRESGQTSQHTARSVLSQGCTEARMALAWGKGPRSLAHSSAGHGWVLVLGAGLDGQPLPNTSSSQPQLRNLPSHPPEQPLVFTRLASLAGQA